MQVLQFLFHILVLFLLYSCILVLHFLSYSCFNPVAFLLHSCLIPFHIPVSLLFHIPVLFNFHVSFLFHSPVSFLFHSSFIPVLFLFYSCMRALRFFDRHITSVPIKKPMRHPSHSSRRSFRKGSAACMKLLCFWI